MTTTLQKRIHTLIGQVLDSYDGAWLVWIDQINQQEGAG
jgi:hypothetical protein